MNFDLDLAQVGIYMARHTFCHEVWLFLWQGHKKCHTPCRDIQSAMNFMA
jgi:hypothetical protein